MSSANEPLFGCDTDFETKKCQDAERYRLMMGRYDYWQRQFVAADQTGVDGVTSIPATRQFTSAGATFTAFSPRDRLRILSPAADQGYYRILTITNNTMILVDRNWEVGSLTDLSWEVSQFDLYEDEQHDAAARYLKRDDAVPMYFRMDPSKQLLQKYGWDEQRDSIISFSVGVLELSPHIFVPKIGDLFRGPDGTAFQLHRLTRFDYFSHTSDFLHYVGAADRMEGRPLPTDF